MADDTFNWRDHPDDGGGGGGGYPGVGNHYARIIKIEFGTSSKKGTPYAEVLFKMLGGQSANTKCKSTFYLTELAMKRLYKLGEAVDAPVFKLSDKAAFARAFLGRTLIVEVIHDEIDSRKNPGRKITIAEIEWGLIPLDENELQQHPFEDPALYMSGAAGAPGGGGEPVVDDSDLPF